MERPHRFYNTTSLSNRLFHGFVALSAALGTTPAYALPQGGVVAGGNVSFAQSGDTLIIDQASNRAIINWQSFDIGSRQRVDINNAGGVQLDRVTGGNATQILGTLNASGQVMLVNGNGVFFGKNAQVNVAGLLVSTADISNNDFNNGHYNFSIPGRADATIINRGHITARDRGLVALIAPGVENSGVISARMGTVQLASSQTFTMDFYGDGLYSFALGRKTNQKTLAAAVSNSGVIRAQGGRVYLTANAAKNVVDHAINMSGIIDATAAHVEGGTIVLDGGGSGTVRVAGTLNASGKRRGQKGGSVQVLGDAVALASTAVIDASGNAAGGFVETSGHTLNIGDAATIAVGASHGAAGSWLLDPYNVTIGNTNNGKGSTNGGAPTGTAKISAATIENALASGNVIITTGGAGSAGGQAGNITVNSGISWSSANSLTLNAENNIAVKADITAASGSVTLTAGHNIVLGTTAQGANVSGWNVSLTSGNNVRLNGSSSLTANMGGGTLDIDNSGTFFSHDAGTLNGSVVTLRQNNGGNIQKAIDAVGTHDSATLTLGSGTWTKRITIGQDNFTLTGAGATTTIKANGNNKTVISSTGRSNVTVSNLTVDGNGKSNITGIGFTNVSGGAVQNVAVNNTETGILFDASYGTVQANILGNTATGIAITGTTGMAGIAVVDNTIRTGGTGISVSGDNDGVSIDNTTVDGMRGDGIDVSGSTGVTIGTGAANTLDNIGGIGISATNHSDSVQILNNRLGTGGSIGGAGIRVSDSDFAAINYNTIDHADTGISVSNLTDIFSQGGNSITGNHLFGDATGISIDRSNGVNVLTNIGTGITGDGIDVTAGDSDYLTGNQMTSSNGLGTGILLNAATHAQVGNPAINQDNRLSGFHTGIGVTGGSNASLLDSNTIIGAVTGVAVSNSSNVEVFATVGTGITGDGIDITSSDHAYLIGNNLASSSGTGTGLSLNGATHADAESTLLSGFHNGISVAGGSGSQIRGGGISNAVTGILLDGTDATVDSVTLSGNTTGIQVQNGAAATVSNTSITGGTTGIALDGAGSTLSFSGSGSSMTGTGTYFALTGGALQGQYLDARQQTFDGVQGVAFTAPQLAAAEAKTIDGRLDAGAEGLVQYTNTLPTIPPAPGSGGGALQLDLQLLDQVFQFEKNLPPQPTYPFSFSGALFAAGTTPHFFHFLLQSVDLSLLAGGNGGFTPGQFPGLAPKAGGDNPQQLAELSPGAGPNTPPGGAPNCGNSFLGQGFHVGFSATVNCTQ